MSALTIETIDTPSLGDRSYLVHDGDVAFVVDPQRDIDRVLALLERAQVRLVAVFETHIHNDYLTGGLALAELTGADYYVNAADPVTFQRTPISDGEVITLGERMMVTALATPGHTFTHLSYALAEGDSAIGVFSGGSLLFGATGRPDLLGPDHTHDLARHQHASTRRLAALLPDHAEVFPTHGFGSFCSASQSESTASTIGAEKEHNSVLRLDEADWIEELLAGLDEWPTYYAHMGPGNTVGPTAPDLSLPPLADAAEVRRRIEAGEWVIDLRHRAVFAAGHAPGTLNFGIDGQFATYLGWLVTWGTPLTLLGSTQEEVATAQRELVRIGIDRPAAHSAGVPEEWSDRGLATFPTASFAELAHVRHHRRVTVLDVRRAKEYAAGWIEGSINIPLHELPQRLADVPAGEVWVHCAAGYRASIAASLLAAAGHTLVAVDDDFSNAERVGLPMVEPVVDAA